jgi:DNA-binding NtrC family response regulator
MQGVLAVPAVRHVTSVVHEDRLPGTFHRPEGGGDDGMDLSIVFFRFRLDLYYRLSIIQIDIPPLRERGDDVLLLSQYYIDTIGARIRRKKKITGLSPEAKAVFRKYRWPGNVRELRNVIERALILEDEDQITTEYLPGGLLMPPRLDESSIGAGEHVSNQFVLPNEGISLDEAELSFVRQAIQRSGGNQTRAAELLGISRDQLRYRLKKLEEQTSE